MSDTRSQYYPTIGLEIHAQLKTQTGMFCDCKNDPNETRPNVNICPICTGMPGAIPTINEQAVQHMIRIGLAVGGEIANFTEFDRKNYFYPDIPKGYQITQNQYPIVSGGKLAGVELERIHLEEDTGTSVHDRGDYSLINYNRSGTPLMELVTKPVIHSAEEAGRFARELQLLLRYLGVASANMEKGEMRVEVNISISPDPDTLGTKVEVKNINSFRAAEKAIDYEIERMTQLHEAGKAAEIVQETRGWDENKGITKSQRKKESSHDYRYFPDPDLPKLYLHELFNLDELRETLPELPAEKRARYAHDFGIKAEDIESYITDHELDTFFANVAILLDRDQDLIRLASNYITSDIAGIKKNGDMDNVFANIGYSEFAELIKINAAGTVNSRAAKDILATMIEQGGDPTKIAEAEGLIQQNDAAAIQKIAEQVITENPGPAGEVRNGKDATIKFLVGQGMKLSKGSANPTVLEQVIKGLLS